jgi:RNA polymerase sigma-70 factor (ECF subfamily)
MGFLTVFEKASLFHTGYRFRPWFYKILTNLYYYELRKRKRGLQYMIEIPDKNIDYGTVSHRKTITSEIKPALDALQQKEKRVELGKLVSFLPDKQKAALILHIYNELSYKEIALTLDCSIGTVKSRIHYALRNLKGKIAQPKGEGEI